MNNTFPSLPILNDINSVLKFYNYDWTINLANIIARHQMRLVNGKDILFKSHRKDILEKLNWWYETYKIKEKLDKNELTASLMGKTIFGLLETSDGNIDLWINPFNFTSRVSKINEIEQGADLARHFCHRAIFTVQREGMMWNNIRHLASGIIIPISLKKPVKSKLGNIFNRSFVMRIGIFQDITDYEIWKTKSVERTAEGKRAKHKSDVGLGIRFFKIIIPLEFANKYDSHWLSFVRDLKNDEVINKKEYFWKDISKLNNKQRLELFDIDILKENLKAKKGKGKIKND